MEDRKVNFLLERFQKGLPRDAEKIRTVRRVLDGMSEEDFVHAQSIKLKNPNFYLVLSIFLGLFGIDRMISGHIFSGICKLALTIISFLAIFSMSTLLPDFGELSPFWKIFFFAMPILWWGLDLFIIQYRVRKTNFEDVICNLQAYKKRTDAKQYFEGYTYNNMSTCI